MARETVEVPVRVRMSVNDTDAIKGGTLVCRICIICFSLVPEDFIQQHVLQAHDLEVPDNG